jgi:hypothetical protein
MDLTGYEKSLSQYTKSELINIAKKYTIYYQTPSGKGSIGNYENLSKEKLIDLIEKDRDYQREKPGSRIEILKRRIVGITDPEEIMIEIISVFRDLEIIPSPGKYYTFIYNAKTPKIRYDQHPLIAALELFPWGFKGLNFHWQDVDPSQCIRNYTWNEVAGQLHVVYGDEIDFMKRINYSKFRTK